MTLTPPLSTAQAQIGFGISGAWNLALDQATAGLQNLKPDLVCVFTSSAHISDMPSIAEYVWRSFGAPTVLGASGQGVILQHSECEREPAVAVLTMSLPGAILSPVRVSSVTLEGSSDTVTFRRRLGVLPKDVRGWIVLAHPFRFDIDGLVTALNAAYPGTPIIGGLASPDLTTRDSALILNSAVICEGAVLLGIGGPYDLFPISSLGADPIGDPWTITGVNGQWIETIANRPALDVLHETIRRIPDELQDRTRRNLLLGFALDEYRDDFGRGDHVIRSITGIDQSTGAIASGYMPRPGQTVQFQFRDAATADLDLTLCLDGARLELTRRKPVATLAFAGIDRGTSLFGTPNHDAALVQKKFPGVPAAGLFTAAEIGPTSEQYVLNTHSVSLGMIVPRAIPSV